MREISEIGRSIAETDAWIKDLAQRVGWRDRGKTYADSIEGPYSPQHASRLQLAQS